MEDAHCKTVDEVVNVFNVDLERGLSPDQVKRNQEKYGLNGEWKATFVYIIPQIAKIGLFILLSYNGLNLRESNCSKLDTVIFQVYWLIFIPQQFKYQKKFLEKIKILSNFVTSNHW